MRAANQPLENFRKPSETGRYVLLVDRQAKRSFNDRQDAEAEAKRILDRFPHLHVGIEDQESSYAGTRMRS